MASTDQPPLDPNEKDTWEKLTLWDRRVDALAPLTEKQMDSVLELRAAAETLSVPSEVRSGSAASQWASRILLTCALVVSLRLLSGVSSRCGSPLTLRRFIYLFNAKRCLAVTLFFIKHQWLLSLDASGHLACVPWDLWAILLKSKLKSCFSLQLPIEDLCSLSSRSLQSPFTATVPASTEDMLRKGFQMLDMENDRIETAQQVTASSVPPDASPRHSGSLCRTWHGNETICVLQFFAWFAKLQNNMDQDENVKYRWVKIPFLSFFFSPQTYILVCILALSVKGMILFKSWSDCVHF